MNADFGNTASAIEQMVRQKETLFIGGPQKIESRISSIEHLEIQWHRGIVRYRPNHTIHSFSPEPAGMVHLFASFATAGLGQDSLPFNISLVIGVDRVVDVQGVLEVLASAGVEHRPLGRDMSAMDLKETMTGYHTKVAVSLGTQEMKIILFLH
jgi:hypothetical protein